MLWCDMREVWYVIGWVCYGIVSGRFGILMYGMIKFALR